MHAQLLHTHAPLSLSVSHRMRRGMQLLPTHASAITSIRMQSREVPQQPIKNDPGQK